MCVKRAAYRAHSLQVVLATKDANVKTRTAACDLLVAVAGVVLRNTDPSGGEECSGLSSLLTKLLTGVAGTTPHMAGASLLALARLTHEIEQKHKLQPIAPRLIEASSALLQHRAKEVARAALTLALRAVSCVSLPELNGLLPALVPALTRCNAGRARVRYVFERLVQRCGSEAVVDAIPPSVGGFWRSRRGLTALKPKAKPTTN